MPATAPVPRAARPAAPRGRLTPMWRLLEGARVLDVSTLLIGGSAALLTILGLVMVLSASSVEAVDSPGGSYALFVRQLVFAAVGVVALTVLSRMPLRLLKAIAWPALLVALLLLVLVAIPGVGVEVNGNRNWLRIGGLQMQPSEAAKLALILWSAAVLERKGRLIRHVRHALLPVVPTGLLMILLVLSGNDLGTALILAGILGAVLFVAGTNRKVFTTAAVVAGVGALAMTLLAPHRLIRVQAWLGIDGACSSATDPCYQPQHGIIALATGGWWGQGLGQSRQKWSYIPEAENDFIFSILGEELGLAGTIVVLVALALLAVGMYRVAAGTTSTFVRLSTWGVMTWLVGQAFLNIAMVTGLLPVVGVPLPFISYGGSALTLALAAVGVVLAFARHERQRAAALAAPRSGPRRAAEPLPSVPVPQES